MTDPFETFLRDAAGGYNRPPAAVPRDAMWAAVSAERRRRAAARRERGLQRRWVVGIAAVLLLGVALGRFTAPRPGGAGAAAVAGAPVNTAAYQAATSEYLARVETVLTMFRMQARTGRPDRGVSTTARGLLSTSRLLLDSPAATDPRMKQLLEDLELVLAQIAQASAEQGVDPTTFILQALEANSVLFRLRAAVPTAPPLSAQGAL